MNKLFSKKKDNKKEKEALEKLKPKTLDKPQPKVEKKELSKEKKKEITEDQPKVLDSEAQMQADTIGINLIPTLTEEEVVVEESKKKMNIGSILSLLTLVLVSLGIVAFNIFTKTRLNMAKEELYVYENKVMGVSQKIINNNEILERVSLYKDIEKGAFSPKEVIDYINDIADKSGGNTKINDFTFGDDLVFTFAGTANDLEEVSKLWYLLTHDPKVEIINLESVGKGANSVRFDFEGKLVFDDFTNISIGE